MTKKFWKDWQNRIDKTITIYGWSKTISGRYVKINTSLLSYELDWAHYKILSINFHGDVVKFECLVEDLFEGTKYRKYITLHRTQISTVTFKK